MKLFLASEAKASIKDIEVFVHGLSGKSIAYIHTAANGEKWGSWRESETVKLLISLHAKVEELQLEDYTSGGVLSHLVNKDIIWFAGGMTGYLMYWIRRVGLDNAIKNILEKTVYVGSSAGSMIAGQTLDITEWYPGDQEKGASLFPALALVDFDIYPHYDESMLPIIQEKYNDHKLYMLKNGEAVTVENEKIQVIGEEKVLIK